MSPSQPASPRPAGLRTIENTDRFDAAAAVGGWRGAAESVLPTLVFILVLAVRPAALTTALVASLTLSGVALLARLLQRQGLMQVVGGALMALLSAAWAWRSGRAANFYAMGLLINTVFLTVCLGSLLLRRPLVGALVELWRAGTTGTAGDDKDEASMERDSWRTDSAHGGLRRRYVAATGVLTAMFALRLLVEVPLYLAGEAAIGALGTARLVLGPPLYALCLWFVWLLVRPGASSEAPETEAATAAADPYEGRRAPQG